MLAVDTNVVVRFLTNDDPAQSEIVRRLVVDHQILLLDTVLLETEWVLRRGYGYSRQALWGAFDAFVKLSAVQLENPQRMTHALDWFAHGMDFADALHLAASRECEAFASFDRKLATAAKKAKAAKVKVL